LSFASQEFIRQHDAEAVELAADHITKIPSVESQQGLSVRECCEQNRSIFTAWKNNNAIKRNNVIDYSKLPP